MPEISRSEQGVGLHYTRTRKCFTEDERLTSAQTPLLDGNSHQLRKSGWTLRRIERATGVRRETAAGYLKAAGVAVRPPGSWGRRLPSKPANEVTTSLNDGLAADERFFATLEYGQQLRMRGKPDESL